MLLLVYYSCMTTYSPKTDLFGKSLLIRRMPLYTTNVHLFDESLLIQQMSFYKMKSVYLAKPHLFGESPVFIHKKWFYIKFMNLCSYEMLGKVCSHVLILSSQSFNVGAHRCWCLVYFKIIANFFSPILNRKKDFTVLKYIVNLLAH